MPAAGSSEAVFGQGDVTVLGPDGAVVDRVALGGRAETNIAFGPRGSGRIYVVEDELWQRETYDVGAWTGSRRTASASVDKRNGSRIQSHGIPSRSWEEEATVPARETEFRCSNAPYAQALSGARSLLAAEGAELAGAPGMRIEIDVITHAGE